MSTITITPVDLGSVILKDAVFRDDVLAFSVAGTVRSGTLLARHSVSGHLVPLVIGGTNETNVPKTVLTYEVSAISASDIPIRAMASGFVRQPRLIIDADGDDRHITATLIDQLRDYGIVPIETQELNRADNT